MSHLETLAFLHARGLDVEPRALGKALRTAVDALEARYFAMDGNEPCVALYERAQPSIPASPAFHRLLADPVLLDRLKRACAVLNYVLL